MIKVTTKVTYRVPEWAYCNCQATLLKPSKDKCRFCVKDGKNYRCALYNEMLSTSQGTLVEKTRACVKAGCGFNSEVVDEVTPAIEPQAIISMAINEYRKVYKSLRDQGYPEPMADKLAQQYMNGGK